MDAEIFNAPIFFKPDLEFVEWLVNYAGDRLIIDVGCGQGHLLNMIKICKGRVMGLEPNFNYESYVEYNMMRNNPSFNPNEVLPYTIERAENLINSLGAEKAMLVFARPCHSNFVENGIENMPVGMEALYITLPENIDLYHDLGRFDSIKKKINHHGTSEEKEVVYSIIKK